MSKILVTSIGKNIEIKIKDYKIKKDFNKLINKFIDVNVEVLQDPAPQYRLFFSDERERNPVYKLFEISKEDIEELVKKIPSLDSNWKVSTEPFFILITMIIRELTLKNNDKITFKNALMYLTFAMYSSLQYKYFRVPPNEDIINYTINNINNKFLFKSYGNVIGALEHTADVNHEKYKRDLISNDDTRIIKYLINLRIRLNNLIKNFKNEYEKNRINKNYLAHETDNMSDDNYKETDNISMDISKIVSDLSIKFFTSSINEKLIYMSSTTNHIDKTSLYNVVSQIKNKETILVERIISYIIEIFMTETNLGADYIKSKKFIVEGLQIYSRSNTKDERIINIKKILEHFLISYCKKYIETERLITKNNYKKGLFTYFILYIANTK